MLWPTSLMGGKILILSNPGNFNAAYIRRSFELCGVPLIIATPNEAGSPTAFSLADVEAVVACVAVDLLPEEVKALAAKYPLFPMLVVGNYFGLAVPDVTRWMSAPFASYQVIERLIGLLSPQCNPDGLET
jgi:hypothetical protein